MHAGDGARLKQVSEIILIVVCAQQIESVCEIFRSGDVRDGRSIAHHEEQRPRQRVVARKFKTGNEKVDDERVTKLEWIQLLSGSRTARSVRAVSCFTSFSSVCSERKVIRDVLRVVTMIVSVNPLSLYCRISRGSVLKQQFVKPIRNLCSTKTLLDVRFTSADRKRNPLFEYARKLSTGAFSSRAQIYKRNCTRAPWDHARVRNVAQSVSSKGVTTPVKQRMSGY